MVTETLAQFPFFHVLHPDDLQWLDQSAIAQSFQPGHILIQEGEPSEFIYLFMEGKLEVTVSQAQGNEKQISVLTTQTMMGEMSFLDARPPAASIRAIASSQGLALPKSQLGEKLKQDRAFAARFYHVLSLKLSKQLRDLSDILVQNQAKAGESLRKVLIAFSELDDRDIAWVIANGTIRKFTPGTVAIAEGQPVEGMFLIVDGTMAVSICQKEIAKSLRGEILGEMSFVEMGNASATITADAPSTLLVLPRAKLEQKLEEDSVFAAHFYRAIALVLADRWRDRLFQRGFAQIAYNRSQMLSDDLEVEDEIDFDVLDSTAIAAARFDWLTSQVRRLG